MNIVIHFGMNVVIHFGNETSGIGARHHRIKPLIHSLAGLRAQRKYIRGRADAERPASHPVEKAAWRL
jgi:hypothetical protein